MGRGQGTVNQDKKQMKEKNPQNINSQIFVNTEIKNSFKMWVEKKLQTKYFENWKYNN